MTDSKRREDAHRACGLDAFSLPLADVIDDPGEDGGARLVPHVQDHVRPTLLGAEPFDGRGHVGLVFGNVAARLRDQPLIALDESGLTAHGELGIDEFDGVVFAFGLVVTGLHIVVAVES